MIRLTKKQGGDTIYIHPGHVLTVEEDGAGSELELSTDKKLSVDEPPGEVAIRVANSVRWHWAPKLNTETLEFIRGLGFSQTGT